MTLSTHTEIHFCATATDAARLATAGLPRLDLEPQTCGSCSARVGEVNGQDGVVFWRACGLVLDGDRIATVCGKCLAGIDKALTAR